MYSQYRLAELLQELRRRSGSIRRLANITGVLPRTVSAWLKKSEDELQRLQPASVAKIINAAADLRVEPELFATSQPNSATAEADRDDLVPLLRKMVFQRDLKTIAAEAASEHYPLSLIVIDGDGLKRVNDEYGHDAGDELIKSLGDVLSQRVRKRGSGYRFGGDEFAVLLPNQTAQEAQALAESMRAEIEQKSVGTRSLRITATFGVACFPEHAQDADGLFKAADQALLAAKKKGRNCVEIAKIMDHPSGAPVHGDLVAEKAAEDLRAVATTREREAALDAKACLLLDLCHVAFLVRVTRWQESGTLAQTSVVRKRMDPRGVFALESQYRFPNGSCAFTYELRSQDLGGETRGAVQVEVPLHWLGDPLLTVRWLSIVPEAPAERTLQQSASALADDGLPNVRALVDQQMANLFGRALDQLARQVKNKNAS